MHPDLTPEQRKSLHDLSLPFHPDDLSWRVTNKSKDGKRGCVIPYADQRAYTDRLNEVFTPAGWTRTYQTTTLSSIERFKKDKIIHTGKVIVTCVVTIHGFGTHSGVGEMWADDDNAMTRSEAQAFKRACSCFGLGRYFYDFTEIWVDLDNYGKPTALPVLPSWALPPGVFPLKKTGPQEVPKASSAAKETATPADAAAAPQTGPQAVTTTLDPTLTKRIESFRPLVGDALYFEVFRAGGEAKSAKDLPSVEAQRWVEEHLVMLDRGIQKVRKLAAEVHENVFYAVLDAEKVQSIDKLPSFAVLKAIVRRLQEATHTAAA